MISEGLAEVAHLGPTRTPVVDSLAAVAARSNQLNVQSDATVLDRHEFF